MSHENETEETEKESRVGELGVIGYMDPIFNLGSIPFMPCLCIDYFLLR
jgi:hypothetical protein